MGAAEADRLPIGWSQLKAEPCLGEGGAEHRVGDPSFSAWGAALLGELGKGALLGCPLQ